MKRKASLSELHEDSEGICIQRKVKH